MTPSETLVAYVESRFGPGRASSIVEDIRRNALDATTNNACPLACAYYSMIDFCAFLTIELVNLGYPPKPPPKESISWDKQRVANPMPADVFQLHEQLRDAIFLLSSLRQKISKH